MLFLNGILWRPHASPPKKLSQRHIFSSWFAAFVAVYKFTYLLTYLQTYKYESIMDQEL